MFSHVDVLLLTAVCVCAQGRETCSGTCSGRRWPWLRPAPTCERWPTATCTSSSATRCRRCWSSTRPSPTTSPGTCCSPTTYARGSVRIQLRLVHLLDILYLFIYVFGLPVTSWWAGLARCNAPPTYLLSWRTLRCSAFILQTCAAPHSVDVVLLRCFVSSSLVYSSAEGK